MFHDIFSNKREKETKRLNIIIDHREKNSLVPSELVKSDFNIEFKHLLVADYLIGNIAIERKTISDLKNSIIDKRIFSQLKEIKQYENSFLIIEGNNEELFNNKVIHENAIRGFLISAQKNFNIPLLFTKNEIETVKYIQILSRKEKNNQSSVNPKKISLDINEQKKYILESFPGIGPLKAKALIEKFGSLNRVFNANESELKEILGKKTKDFLELIRL